MSCSSKIFLLALLPVYLTLPLLAQYRASLQGTVTDSTGAVVPAATVTLTSKETSNVKTATTSDSGVYAVPGLAPGLYTLTVTKQGFAPKTLPNLLIASEQARGQDVQIDIAGSTATTVTVNAEQTPAVNTENATISGTFSGREVEALPTFGRDPFQVAQLAPGSFGDNARSAGGGGSSNLPGSAGPGGTSATSSIFATENQVQIVANGTRNSSNSFQVDGIGVNSLAWGGAAVITPNEESVKEVTVQSSPYSAESGRGAGAQVMVVSKNGTNEFHGSAFFKADRPGLNAFQRYDGPNNPPQRDNDRFNQWSGSLGGPIIKNHLFFFFSYETLLNGSSATGLNWYETPQFLAATAAANPTYVAGRLAAYPGEGAAFNAIVPRTCAQAGIADPNACQAIFSGGQYLGLDVGSPLRGVARGVQDPGYVNNGNFGTGGGLDGVPDIFFVQTANPTTQRPQQYSGRADYQATSKDLIAFTSYYVPNNSTFYNGPARPANFWNSDRLNESAAVLWNRTISPIILNEARFNVTRWHFNEIASNPQEPFGLPQLQTDNFGGITGIQPLGAPGPGVFAQTTYNFRDTVSTTRGNHNIRTGVDLYWEQNADNSASAGRPQFFYRNLWSLANDAPYQEVGNFDPRTGQPSSATKYIRSSIDAGFIQDDYRVLPNLTLNLGLRYEYFAPVHEKYGNISAVVLGNGPNPLVGLKLRLGGDLYNASKFNFGPQFGFAWRPNPNSERFVVRGGFGIGYNRIQEAITLNGRNNPPLVANFTLTGSNVLLATPSSPTQFSGYPANPAATQAFDPVTNLPINASQLSLVGFPNNMPNPYTYRYSLDMQYDLGGNWTAKLGYQGSNSRHLGRQENLNLNYGLTNPAIQTMDYFTNDTTASYNSLQAELEHRFSNQFQADFQYSWSKAIDEGSNDYFLGDYPFGRQYLRGPSDFDVRHLIKLYGTYTPIFFKGNGWKEKILGNWQVSGILNYHTGFPWTPQYSNTGNNLVYPNSGYGTLRPSTYLGGAGTDYSNSSFEGTVSSNFPKGALAYFGVPTFPATGIPSAPAVGRNVLTGPNYFDIDMTLQKAFGLPKLPIFGEGARFEFRANAYNLFNKVNLTPLSTGDNGIARIISTDGVTSNPFFGISQSALGSRIIELQARFTF